MLTVNALAAADTTLIPVPVSYTHLDVYKRQGVGGAVAHKDEGDLLLSGGIQAVETGILHSGSGNGLGNRLWFVWQFRQRLE